MTRHIKRAEGTASVTDSGTITGYASTFTREPDWAGDVVAKGAFAEWLHAYKAGGTTLPLLYNHDQSLDSFIGRVTDIREDEHGLIFTAGFDATEKAQRARELAMDGRPCKFSFAYDVLDQGTVELGDGREANELRELDIHEVSLVTYPANPDTSVVEVKGAPGPGAKAGRRNSRADEDAIRQAIALLRGVLGEEADDDHDAPERGDQTDADDADATPEGGESSIILWECGLIRDPKDSHIGNYFGLSGAVGSKGFVYL